MAVASKKILTARQRRAAEALRYADSYSRGDRIVDLYMAWHPDALTMIGQEWSGCDYYPPETGLILRALRANPDRRSQLMDDTERAFLAALPDRVAVFRGCYEINRRGFSWSTSPDVAAKFPFFLRYRRDGEPLLLEGRVGRDDILFVKLDRDEFEVVALPDSVEVIAATPVRCESVREAA